MPKDYCHTLLKCLLLLIIGGFCVNSNAQSKAGNDYSSDDIENLINYNPAQSLEIAQLLLSKPNIAAEDKAKLILLIAKAYKAKGNYSNCLTFLYEEKKYEDYLSEQEKFEIEIEKVKLLRSVSLDKQSLIILNKAAHELTSVTDEKRKDYFQTLVTMERGKNLEKDGYREKSIRLFEDLWQTSKTVFTQHPDLKASYNVTLGNLYVNNNNPANAGAHFEQVITQLNKQKSSNLYIKALASSGLAEVYFLRGEYNRSLLILKEAFSNSKKLSNVLLQETIIKQQLQNYLALNDKNNYTETNVRYLKMQTQFDSIASEAMNTSYKLVSNEISAHYTEKEKVYFNVLYGLIFCYVLVFVYYILVWRKKHNTLQNLEEIIRYIEITRNTLYNVLPVKTQETKKYVISKDLEDEILKKLKRFENAHKFVNKELSLSMLAVQFDTNVKYLSDIISSNYNLNFNAYINTLRINYIIEKLKTEPDFKNYKISYLADYCGFSAHSSFATVFKSITGISPVKFIELLKTEKENNLLS